MRSSTQPAGTLEGAAEVVVISPHPVVFEGFAAMLGRHPGWTVSVGAGGAGEAAARPDVALYDVMSLADGDGADLGRLVGIPTCVVVAVERDLAPRLLERAVACGVHRSVSMAATEPELLAALRSALAERDRDGAEPTTRGVAVADPFPDLPPTATGVPLSPRQVEVLTMIAEGLSNDESARRSFLSVNSVKSHIRSAYSKIDVQTRAQAAAWAVRHGLDRRPRQ